MNTNETVKFFYIQDMRQYVGNSILWWGINRSGYTTDIDKAGKYTESEAQKICRDRKTDRAFPCKYIDSVISKHVDMQRVDIKRHLPIHRTTRINHQSERGKP